MLEEAATVLLNEHKESLEISALAHKWKVDPRVTGLDWQKRGLGNLSEIAGREPRQYMFRMSSIGFDVAHAVRKNVRARTLVGRISSINWNAVNALAAGIAAVAAVIAAYFSYLSYIADHAQKN
jgi:hypothetical protein